MDMARTGPLLTFVINVRNGEKYIHDAISSALGQTVPCEVLVVDNQSTDSTREVVGRFPTVRILSTPHSMTLGAARNFSLGLIATPYVTWLDSDDLVDSKFAETYLATFEEFRHVGFLSSGCALIDGVGNLLPRVAQRPYFYPDVGEVVPRIFGDSLQYCAATGFMRGAWVSYAFRTDLVRQVGGFDVGLHYAEDFDLILRLCCITSSLHVLANLASCRVHSEQVTQTMSLEARAAERQMVIDSALRRFGFSSREYVSYLKANIAVEKMIEAMRSRKKGVASLRLVNADVSVKMFLLVLFQKVSNRISNKLYRTFGMSRFEQVIAS